MNRVWRPTPAYWRILHGAGFWFEGCPIAAGMLQREGVMRGKRTGAAAKMGAEPRAHALRARGR